jgi:hypothetical protein
MRTILLSLVIGVGVTAVLTAAASLCSDFGAEVATRILSWPNTLLQSLTPRLNIGTAEKPLYEGTPVNILAYFASFPLSVGVYAVLAYMVLRKRWPMSGGTDGGVSTDAGK